MTSEPAALPSVEAPIRRIGFRAARRETVEERLSHIEFLVNEAFHEPSSGIAYYVSQRLAGLFPDRTLVESREYAFDPVRYASHGHCRLRARRMPYPHWILHWEESADALGKVDNRFWQGWCEVTWEDEQLEVLILHWEGGRSYVRHSFILADSREVAVRFLRTVCAWNVRPRDELLVFEDHEWEKDRDLFRAIKGASLESLVLPGSMKEELVADATGFFSLQETYRRYGVPWKRGILFTGPPGNGKTHAVKALINALGKPCLYVKSFGGRGGASEYAISQVFTKARRTAPCILVLEDLDTLVSPQNRSVFLNELDGFAGNDGILTVATSNHPERLDPAIAERPSRFDRTYHFALPGREERRAYLALWNEGLEPELRVTPDVVTEVAEFTGEFSFAYLKELCLSALVAWVRCREAREMATALREQVQLLRRQLHGQKPANRR